MARILVTGAAGFIGFHLAQRLLAGGEEVVGLDNLNDYYDVRLKEARLARLEDQPGFQLRQSGPGRPAGGRGPFSTSDRPERVVNLAAQAGVRYSLDQPARLRQRQPRRLPQCAGRVPARSGASISSSPRAARSTAPTPGCPSRVEDNVDHPLSLYAASKKANELMAHSYAHLYGLPVHRAALLQRLWSLGTAGRGAFPFAAAIVADRPIDVYNYGQHRRDFTYIDDIVEGIVARSGSPRAAKPRVARRRARSRQQHGAVPAVQHRQPSTGGAALPDRAAGEGLGREARKNLLPMQPGDVEDTCRRRCGTGARRRLRAGDPDRRRRRAVRRLVSGVSRCLTIFSSPRHLLQVLKVLKVLKVLNF